MTYINVIFYFVAISSLSIRGNAKISPVNDYAASLRKELFDPNRYDPSSFPYNREDLLQQNESKALEIRISLLVIHVQDLDAFTGTLTTNAWFLLYWNDYRLQWDSSDFGDVYELLCPPHQVWIPELSLLNDVEAMILKNVADSNIFLYHDGSVYWNAPINFKTSCYINHKFYPFDEHSCKISIRLWSVSIYHYDLKVNHIDEKHEEELLSHFATDNPLWEVTSRKSEIITQKFGCCLNFSWFESTLGLKRRDPLFKYILITPAVTSILLTLVLFWLPPTANAKIGLGGIVIGIQIALLMYLGWHIPSGGNSIPAIVLFCGNTLIMAALTVVCSVFVMRITNTPKETAVPDWVKFLTRDPCKTILCFGNAESKLWVRFVAQGGLTKNDEENAEMIDSESIDTDNQPKTDNSAVSSDWFLIGIAIDRFCFIVYCFVIAIITITSFS